MSYAAKDGKDTVVFVDKEYVDSQEDIPVPTQQQQQQQEPEQKDQSAAYDPETGEINWDCPCKYLLNNPAIELTVLLNRSWRYGTRTLWRTIQSRLQLFCIL
jgi:hypothetical protein